MRNKLMEKEKKVIREEIKQDEKKNGGKKRKSEKAASQAPKKAKTSSTGAKKKPPPKMMKKANGQLKPRVTSQGNKRMSIPEDLFPEFCRRIGANGTGERMKLINKFAEDFPTVSVRQVTLRLGEITTRDLPKGIPPLEKKGGRAFMFYLLPRFYKFLPEDERPEEWEKRAEEDERKYQEEKEGRKTPLKSSSVAVIDPGSDKMDGASITTGASPSVADDDGEETEDEGDPA